MFCYKCGSKIPDNAHFCPFCGEVLEEITSPPMETSVNSTSVLDSDLKLSFEGDGDYISSSQYIPIYKRKEINLYIENTSSYPIHQIELQLSGPSQINIPSKSQKFRVIESNTTRKATFTIVCRDIGNFILTATLLSDSGHSIVLPISLQFGASKVPYQKSLKTTSRSSTAGSFVAIAIVLGLIAVMLIGFGIPTAFSSPSVGITMIVIGIIMFSIASQGKCFLCFLGCDGCDGCDCDC